MRVRRAGDRREVQGVRAGRDPHSSNLNDSFVNQAPQLLHTLSPGPAFSPHILQCLAFPDGPAASGENTAASNAATDSRDVTVTNPVGGSGTGMGLLSITTRQGAINNMIDQVNQFLASGQIDQGTANSLLASLNNTGSALARGNNNAAKGILGALINKLNAFEKGGQITSAIRDKFVSEINALLSSL